MDRKKIWIIPAAIAFLFSFFPGAWGAEKYPSREIQIVTTNPPGAIVDVSLRLMKDSLAQELGVPVVVNNRPGGGGATGTQFLVKSKPDGYTIGCIASAHNVVLPAINPTIPYKYSDLDPLCKYGVDTTIVFAKEGAPWKSLEDLIADGKRRPGQITYGASTNSISAFLMEWFLKTSGIQMLHVPLATAQDAMLRILGGNLDIGVNSVAFLAEQLRAKTVRGLFVTSNERVAAFPQIPTLKEKGYPDPLINLYFGFFTPLGVPKPIKERLEKALEKTLQDPALKKRLEQIPCALEYLPAEAFSREIERDHQKITKWVKSPGPSK